MSMTKESCRNTYKIYVGNLAPQTSDHDLRRVFGQFGTVVEAIALSNKGFGFVHFTTEDDGVRAMKSLYKYQLNGKEMVVQPAINPKKAASQYGTRRSIVGKGVSTLDDFEDFHEIDQYLDQEISNCISSDTPPSSQTSPNSNYTQYSNCANNLATDSQNTLNSDSILDGRPKTVDNSIINLVNNVVHTNGSSLVSNYTNKNTIRQPSIWDIESTSNNPLIQHPNNNSLVNLSNRNGVQQPMVTADQFVQPLVKPLVTNQNTATTLSLDNKLTALHHQMNQLKYSYQTNPKNVNLATAINKINQEIHLTHSQQSLQEQLAKEQVKIHQDSLQRLLLQQQQQQQIQQKSAFQLLNINTNLANNPIPTSQINFDNGNSVHNGNASSFSVTMDTNNVNSLPMLSGESNNFGGAGNQGVVNIPLCRLCGESFNSGQQIPKILGCTHTFCLRCLHMVSMPGVKDLQCPSRCGVSTPLPSSGVAGLTTNQTVLTIITNNSSTQFNGYQPKQKDPLNNPMNSCQEVCASCTGTHNEHQALSVCREEGHTLVRAEDAVKLIVSKLKPLVQESLIMLKNAMTLRTDIKQRVDCTISSLEKFMDELKSKRQRDNAEDNVLIGTYSELARVNEQLDSQSYHQLINTYHMMDKCAKDVKMQYSQCLTAGCVNQAVKSVVLEIQPLAFPNVSKLGLKQDEVFEMDRSLQSHAIDGNYANVLLQYMVSDLLSSRVTCHSLLTNEDKEVTILEDPLSRSAASVSPHSVLGDASTSSSILPSSNELTNGVYRSLTASSSATPDMNAMNSHSVESISNNLDHLDINSVIQTTEAIEAECRANSKPDIVHYTDDTSLGLSNICHQIASNDESLENLELLEKSMLEGSSCLKIEETKVESSAPSPNSSNSITPPIIGNAARSSVDSSSASSDSGIASCNKPFSYLDAAKKPAKPQPEPSPKLDVAKLPAQVKQIKTPHCWMKVAVDGKAIGRIVFQLRPDKAPRMCENFLGLCTGKPGYGYQGTHFFKNGDGFLAGGDVEYDDGAGGYSIFGKKKFEADLCPLKDEVGMIRFKGNGTSDAGRGMVGSQFMVWYAEREFKKFSYSLVFGRVVDGLEVVKKAANVNLLKHDVMIEECGGIM